MEGSVRLYTDHIQDVQQKLDARRLKAERAKVKIDELRAIFQRHNTAEIERVLQTDDGGVFSLGGMTLRYLRACRKRIY